MKAYTDRIDYLLGNFALEELTAEDRKLVQEQLSEEEYTEYRKVITTARNISQKPLPPLPAEFQDKLRGEYQKHFSPGSLSILKKALLPFCWMVVGALLGIGTYVSFTDQDENLVSSDTEIEKVDTIYVHKTDTLIEKITLPPETIIKEVIKFVERPGPQNIPVTKSETPLAVSAIPRLNAGSYQQKNFFTNLDVNDITVQRIGKTIAEEEELMSLLKEMPSDGLD